MNRFSLTNNQVKLIETSGDLPIVLEEFMYRILYLQWMKASNLEDVKHVTHNLCPRTTGGWLHMSRLSLRNNRLKFFKTWGDLPIVWEESIEEYTSNEWKHQNWKMWTCNQPARFRIPRTLTNYKCPKTSHAPMWTLFGFPSLVLK